MEEREIVKYERKRKKKEREKERKIDRMEGKERE